MFLNRRKGVGFGGDVAGLVSLSTGRVKRGKADYMGTADEIQENVGGLGKSLLIAFGRL